ncbi:hypothetical protein [Synechococcus sp. MIT S1220]|uniref:hypothetical protein n=1 Tax=Synechococcus sp. MIT S1220 TaxID=3082549 RepID=UPI0039AFBA68
MTGNAGSGEKRDRIKARRRWGICTAQAQPSVAGTCDPIVTTSGQGCHDKRKDAIHFVNTTQRLATHQPVEDTLIDALRGCRRTEELQTLEQRLAQNSTMPPLFDWICDLLVQRRISRALAARLLKQLHDGQSSCDLQL